MHSTPRTAVILLAAIAVMVTALAARADDRVEFTRLMNLGKAHLENRSAADAIETLTEATTLDPASAPAFRNLARAHLLVLRPDAAERALVALARAETVAPDNPATSYLAGLAYIRMSRFDEAIPHFEKAARLDPRTAAVRYQLASAYQAADRRDDAVAQLEATIRFDPQHATAHYRLANEARRNGDRAEAERRMREFMRLRRLFGDETRTPTALETCVHTRPEGPPPPAERMRDDDRTPVRFVDVTGDAATLPAGRALAAVAVIGVRGDGRCTLFAVDTAGRPGLLTFDAGGLAWTEVDLALPPVAVYEACAVANFHDVVPAGERYDPAVHARNDVLLLGETQTRLLRRRGPAEFEDVTESAGLRDCAGRSGRWFDYDHDGDVDLAVAGKNGLTVWQNNGDATFTNVTRRIGVAADGPLTDAAAADLDNDNAIDLVASGGEGPTIVFENRRAGRFAPRPEPPGPWPPARRVLLDDLDNDGATDAALISAGAATFVYAPPAGRSRIALTGLDVAAARLADFDNDGRQDLLLAGRADDGADRGAVRLFRNERDRTWTDATDAAGLAALAVPPVRDVLAADLDGDADTDLLFVTMTGALRLLRNDGGHMNGQLKLVFETNKTNPTGIGTHVEVRAGDLWITRAITGVPIEIGLDGRTQLDSIQTVWTNGIVENQIDVAVPPGPLKIVEKNVAAGSCPFLYAWDGRRYRFVTDLLGNAPIGLSLARDVMLPADPDEFVIIGGDDRFVPDGDAYRIVITDEFRELLYLDTVRLVAVDHPPDVEVHPTDKLMPPPFPESELVPTRTRHPLRAAIGDDGVDRTTAARVADGNYTTPGTPLPPPLRGMCHPLVLTLDFGIIDPSRPLALALTGWLQYGDASTNIAMSQNRDLVVIPPTLEAETADGAWAPVDVVVGMPAGKTKTILCDLTGRLPAGVRRLRLTTTFEIRWDRIALTEIVSNTRVTRHTLPPRTADLRWRGFAELVARAPGHPTTPAYDDVSPTPPWRTTPEGWCTRYGDVRELVDEEDGALAILNGGDALSIDFDAGALPPVPGGRVRTFFLYSVGWDKDEDYNVVGGNRVEPLPGQREEDDASDWRLRFNTRWVPGARW